MPQIDDREAAWPTEIRLQKDRRGLVVSFDNSATYTLSAEYLRVHSPSAEVQGHHPDKRVTVAGKRDVEISAVEPVGNYALRVTFSDGHDTGLYSWSYFQRLGENRDDMWAAYLAELDNKNLDRG